jgi:hypothetical protein
MNNRFRQGSNAGWKNTGLWRTTTMVLSPPPREKAVGVGEIEGPGVTNLGEAVTNLGEAVTNFGEVIEKFERAPCARTSLPPIAKIAAARATRTSVRRITANMTVIRPPHRWCTMQTIHIIAHEGGVGEARLCQ